MSYDFPMTEAELTNFTTAFYAEIGDGKVTTQKLQQLADAITQPGTIPYDKLEAIVNEISPSSEKERFDFPKMLRLLADANRPPDVDVRASGMAQSDSPIPRCKLAHDAS